MISQKCITLLAAEKRKGGGRYYEILFDGKGEILRPIAFVDSANRCLRSYAVIVSPLETYYRLTLRLSNPKRVDWGFKQDKYGRLEVVTYDPAGPFEKFCESPNCPYLLSGYWLCKTNVHGVIWRINPRGSYAILSAIDKAPRSLVKFLTEFEYQVKTSEDLSDLVKFI